jgi:hypothetical protein
MDQVDLLKAFRSFDGFRGMMIENLLPALNDPNTAAVAFFALEVSSALKQKSKAVSLSRMCLKIYASFCVNGDASHH